MTPECAHAGDSYVTRDSGGDQLHAFKRAATSFLSEKTHP